MSSQRLRRISNLTGVLRDLVLRGILTQSTANGPWGHIFDGEPDNAGNVQVRVYETRGLIALGERAAAPALEWLLHEIERVCTSEALLIFVDEARRLLNDPVSAEWFYAALGTLAQAQCRSRDGDLEHHGERGVAILQSAFRKLSAVPARAEFGGSCGCPIIVSDPEIYGRRANSAPRTHASPAWRRKILAPGRADGA